MSYNESKNFIGCILTIELKNRSIMYLSDNEINIIAIYLDYGSGIGIVLCLVIDEILLLFFLESVIGFITAIMYSVYSKIKNIKRL